MQVVIFKQESGRISIIRPTQEAIGKYGIEAIALKDVPHGKPFKIVDASVIPADRSQRNAWTCDDADLTDGVGAEWNVFPEGA